VGWRCAVRTGLYMELRSSVGARAKALSTTSNMRGALAGVTWTASWRRQLSSVPGGGGRGSARSVGEGTPKPWGTEQSHHEGFREFSNDGGKLESKRQMQVAGEGTWVCPHLQEQDLREHS